MGRALSSRRAVGLRVRVAVGWNWGKCGGEGEARTPVRFPAEGEFEGEDASESLDRALGDWRVVASGAGEGEGGGD